MLFTSLCGVADATIRSVLCVKCLNAWLYMNRGFSIKRLVWPHPWHWYNITTAKQPPPFHTLPKHSITISQLRQLPGPARPAGSYFCIYIVKNNNTDAFQLRNMLILDYSVSWIYIFMELNNCFVDDYDGKC